MKAKQEKTRRSSSKMNGIGGVILGELESPKRAREYAEKMKNCPRLLFSAVEAKTFVSVYIVSKDDRWWLKLPEENPERVGFMRAKVYIGQTPRFPLDFPLRRPRGRAVLTPCGADCRKCDLRHKYKCRGCPATRRRT